MEYILNYFLTFLNYVEKGRDYAYENTGKWADKREIAVEYLNRIETQFKNYHPFTLVIGFFVLFIFLKFLLKRLKKIWRAINSFEKIKLTLVQTLVTFGPGKTKLAKTREQIRQKAKDQFKSGQFKKLDFRTNGQDARVILNKLIALNECDKKSFEGEKGNTKITGGIYINDSQLESLVSETVKMYSYSNLLHPDIFCSARFLESELIKLGMDMFNADKDQGCGITTSGGTESILFACLAYRNMAYKKGIKKPEMIIPVTAHAAFFKAGEAFNIKMVKIPLDSNFQVDIRKVERAINSNTCALAGSCPNFPHGIYDNIEALSNLAVKYNIPLHVDACLGGLLVAFFQSANIPIPRFDFRLPGVTSMSADFHKYGLGPKGCSILIYSNRDYRKHQYFIYPHFMGGLYPSPGFEGSRSPAMAIASYAVILHLGRQTYVNQARRIYDAVKKLKTYIRELEGLEVIGDPQICSFAVKGPKSLLVCDQMNAKGWHMNIILNPMGFSFVVTSANIGNIEDGTFIKDIKASHDYVMANKELKISERTKLYGLAIDLPESVVRENMDVICDTMLD